jgi:branched-chain amino acid transport system permease protein
MTQLASVISKERVAMSDVLIRALAPIGIAILLALAMHGLGLIGGAYAERILVNCGVAIIAAVSLTIVNGFTGQFSIGHAAFMAVGGYAAGLLTYYVALSHMTPEAIREIAPSLFGSQQWMLAIACIFAGFVAAGTGWLVGLPSLRLKGDYLAIVTLGFGEIVRVLLQQTPTQIDSAEAFQKAGWLGVLIPPATNGSLGFRDLPKVTNLFWTYLFVGATILIAYRVKTSSYGRALLSIREDEIAAESMGINIAKLKVRAFILAAFFAGVAGALYAHQQGNLLTPKDAGFIRSFDIVMMVVLGGLGSISGSVLAAIVITVLNAWLVPLGPYRMILFALALILMMIFRPQGLFGLREIWEALTLENVRKYWAEYGRRTLLQLAVLVAACLAYVAFKLVVYFATLH